MLILLIFVLHNQQMPQHDFKNTQNTIVIEVGIYEFIKQQTETKGEINQFIP